MQRTGVDTLRTYSDRAIAGSPAPHRDVAEVLDWAAAEIERLRRDINAAVVAEREACAKIIDDNAEGSRGGDRVMVPRTEGNLAGIGYAAAIRARSNSSK